MFVLRVCAIVFAGREDETPDLVLYWFWSWSALGCSRKCLPGSCRIPFDVADPFLWRFSPLVFSDFTPSQSEPLLGWGVSYGFFKDDPSWWSLICMVLCHFCSLFDMFPSLFFPADSEVILFLFIGIMIWRDTSPGGLSNSA